MGLAEDILEWAAGRPWWQQEALARLSAGERFGAEQHQAIAQALLSDPPVPPEGGWLGSTLGQSVAAGEQVRLLAVRDLANINALVAGQLLTFAPGGVTVVYGDNGSGKSGYARLIKSVTRARHQEDVLANIFSAASGVPAAVLSYCAGEQEHEQQWAGQETGLLSQVSFYDERCGDCYVGMEAEVTYRPSVLQLLDALIAVCDGVRLVLDALVKENTGSAVALPAVPEGTLVAEFLRGVSATTTTESLDAACALPDDADEEADRLAGEETRLRTSDPIKEKKRLTGLAASLEAVAEEVTRVARLLGTQAEESLRRSHSEAIEKRAAADVASTASFDAEPVNGVGSRTWRGLWEAARRFSEVEAYPAGEFPVTVDAAPCLLCQQPLADEASHRLHRFHAFMTDDTQRQAQAAEGRSKEALSLVRNVQTVTPSIAVELESLAHHFHPLVELARSALGRFEERRTALLTVADQYPTAPTAAPDLSLVASLRERSTEVWDQAQDIDSSQFAELLKGVVAQGRELEARRTLAAQRGIVTKEVARRRARAALDAARRQTDTTGITRKSTELTRTYVTSLVQDRFVRESDRLGVERVSLQDSGGRKGQLLHRPAFLGATVKADLPLVLSEGEQTALGLAGFFTEVYFDETCSALVLDDPVTSLDHLRRARVATRLAEFARDRQVVVFTHDMTFASDLRKASREATVDFTERSVERRRRDDAPGVCLDKHPWNVKDAAARLDVLGRDLARIKREQADWDGETYEKETGSWAGSLSETWERIISMEIANQLVDRGTLEVSVTMMKVVARITAGDNETFQDSYKRCSLWAKRHDKDQAVHYMPPTVDELEAELALVKEWFDRVRKYKNMPVPVTG